MSTQIPNTNVNISKQGVYEILNEGMGGMYERFAYSNIIKRLVDQNKCKSILELNASYIAGIPGFNSCLLAQAGYDVTVAVKERDLEDTRKVWALTGLKARIVCIEDDKHTSFLNNSFDFVYNHLAFDQYSNPTLLIDEMYRISRKVVMNLTLSPFNYGFIIHRLNHRTQNKKWDHGYSYNSTIEVMKAVHKHCNLKYLESGGCDVPFWMDTVDAKMGESMTYMDVMPKKIRNNWVWTSINPECQNHWMIKMMWEWEKKLPMWYKKWFAHHFYVASVK